MSPSHDSEKPAAMVFELFPELYVHTYIGRYIPTSMYIYGPLLQALSYFTKVRAFANLARTLPACLLLVSAPQ